jgi:hypothetical protein
MKFLPLFTLNLNHAYYADGRCPDFVVEPTPETRRLLNIYRCIAKPHASGIRVLAATADDGSLFIQPAKGITFVFQLILQNPMFPLFTDLPQGNELAPRLYTNQGRVSLARASRSAAAAKPIPLTAATRQIVTMLRKQSGSFADVEISYGDAAPNTAPGPATFQINFAARKVRWKYYLVTDPGADTFQIQDRDKNAPLAFNRPIQLSARAAAQDRVATTLAAQYPGMRLLSILTARAVSCQEQARQSLQLLVGPRLALEGLPNPSLRNHVLESAPDKSYLFHVLKYTTNRVTTVGG